MSEYLWEKIAAKENMRYRTLTLWIGKYVVFNLIYIPALIFFQELLFEKRPTETLLITFFLVGQVALFVYDKVYAYFQGAIWGRFRMRFLK